MADKTYAEFRRDGEGVPYLTLYNLTTEQLDKLRPLLFHNGPEQVYHDRSEAGAHLDAWDSHRGQVSIHFHGEKAGFFLMALEHAIGNKIGYMTRHGRAEECIVNGWPQA